MIHPVPHYLSLVGSGYRSADARIIALVFVTWAVAGCSSLPSNLAADGEIQVDRVDSHKATIGQVYVGAVSVGVRVTGTLRKTFRQRGRIPGHLHIELRAADGTLLETRVIRYHRRSGESGRAYFAHTLTTLPDAVGVVRLMHHGLGDEHL